MTKKLENWLKKWLSRRIVVGIKKVTNHNILALLYVSKSLFFVFFLYILEAKVLRRKMTRIYFLETTFLPLKKYFSVTFLGLRNTFF